MRILAHLRLVIVIFVLAASVCTGRFTALSAAGTFLSHRKHSMH